MDFNLCTNGRFFTTEEIALASGYSKEGVRGILSKFRIKCQIRPTENSREAVWDYTAYKTVMDWKKEKDEIRMRRHTEKPVREEEKTLEQLKAEHPLVTNINCFRLSWWPDIVPDCFKELDND